MTKYGAKKTIIDGITFDSKKEAKRYTELKLLERAGEIRGLELQPKFPIVIDGRQVRYPGSNRPMSYSADFAWFEDTSRRVVDVKGMDTDASKIKRALVEHIYRIKIEVET